MSKPINDGGPAFPAPMFTRQADGQPMCPQEFGLGGMTLRDWFAGQAMSAMVVDAESYGNEITLAECAYIQADAMLSERKEGSK